MSEDYNISGTVKWKVLKGIFVISISWSYTFRVFKFYYFSSGKVAAGVFTKDCIANVLSIN